MALSAAELSFLFNIRCHTINWDRGDEWATATSGKDKTIHFRDWTCKSLINLIVSCVSIEGCCRASVDRDWQANDDRCNSCSVQRLDGPWNGFWFINLVCVLGSIQLNQFINNLVINKHFERIWAEERANGINWVSMALKLLRTWAERSNWSEINEVYR